MKATKIFIQGLIVIPLTVACSKNEFQELTPTRIDGVQNSIEPGPQTIIIPSDPAPPSPKPPQTPPVTDIPPITDPDLGNPPTPPDNWPSSYPSIFLPAIQYICLP